MLLRIIHPSPLEFPLDTVILGTRFPTSELDWDTEIWHIAGIEIHKAGT